MAFTDTQKEKIRTVLGYSSARRYKNTRLESMLDHNSPEIEAIVIEALDKIAEVDAHLSGSVIGSSGVKKVDEIEFFAGGRVIKDSWHIGEHYIGRISIALGVPIYSRYYSREGYLGDTFSGGLGLPMSGRGIIPLG